MLPFRLRALTAAATLALCSLSCTSASPQGWQDPTEVAQDEYMTNAEKFRLGLPPNKPPGRPGPNRLVEEGNFEDKVIEGYIQATSPQMKAYLRPDFQESEELDDMFVSSRKDGLVVTMPLEVYRQGGEHVVLEMINASEEPLLCAAARQALLNEQFSFEDEEVVYLTGCSDDSSLIPQPDPRELAPTSPTQQSSQIGRSAIWVYEPVSRQLSPVWQREDASNTPAVLQLRNNEDDRIGSIVLSDPGRLQTNLVTLSFVPAIASYGRTV